MHALFQQDLPSQPSVDPTLHDLGPRRLRLALGLGDLEKVVTFLLDGFRGYLVTAQILRLGEGTGALLAWPLVLSSACLLNDMASFESAGVSAKATDD